MQNNFTSALHDWKPEDIDWLKDYGASPTSEKDLFYHALNLGGRALMSKMGNPAFGALFSLQELHKSKKAADALGKEYGVIPHLLGNPTTDLTSKLDLNKDGKLTQDEIDVTKDLSQKAFQGGFKGQQVQTMPIDIPDPKKAGIVPMFEYGAFDENPYIIHTPTSNINQSRGVGITGDLGGPIGAGYKGSQAFASGGKGIATGIDTKTSAATVGRGKGTGTSFADDAQSADAGTFICTCLHEIGDLKKYIYKYDQLYAKRVNPAIYRGYTTWGRYIANKMRSKGIIYKLIKPIALAWAYQMAYDLSKGKVGKKSMFIKLTKNLGEGICYVLGQTIKRR